MVEAGNVEIPQAELDTLRASARAGETAAAALERTAGELEISAGRVRELEGASERATGSTAALLQVTREANPNIPSDLINGEDPATIAASVEGARAIVARVSELNPAAEGEKPPPGGAGAPARGGAGEAPAGVRGVGRIAWGLTNEKREE